MYCGNAAPHIVFSRTTGDILILVANITTFGEEKRNWKWMRYNMKSEHNKLLTSTFRPFGNVQCDFDFVLMAHEEKNIQTKNLSRESQCVFFVSVAIRQIISKFVITSPVSFLVFDSAFVRFFFSSFDAFCTPNCYPLAVIDTQFATLLYDWTIWRNSYKQPNYVCTHKHCARYR